MLLHKNTSIISNKNYGKQKRCLKIKREGKSKDIRNNYSLVFSSSNMLVLAFKDANPRATTIMQKFWYGYLNYQPMQQG